MRAFRLFVLRRVAQAPVRAAMTSLAIAAGVTLAVSIAVLTGSIERSLRAFGGDFAGPATLRISGATVRGGLPTEAIARAREVKGVRQVVPMVRLVAAAQAGTGYRPVHTLVLGIDCSVEALLGVFGCEPEALAAATGVIGVGPEVATGEQAVLRTDIGRLPLAGVPVIESLGSLGNGRIVLLPLHRAQEVYTRAGQVDVGYVVLDDSAVASEVQAALEQVLGPHLPVLDADDPPSGSESVLGAALPIFSLLGLFGFGIGAVLVANSAAMSMEARRRELAVLGAVGAHRRAVLWWGVAEMGALGAIGGAVGSLGGAVVARPIVASMSSFTEQFIGAPLHTHVAPGNVVVGLLLGIVLGGGAAFLPARRATRQDVAAELSGREAADQTKPPRLARRAIIWGGVLGLGAIGCWAAPRNGGLEPWQAAVISPANLAMTLSALFVLAALTPLLVERLVRLTAGSRSAPLRISLAAARRDHRRTGVLAVAVSAAVVMSFITAGSSASARAGIIESFERDGPGVDIRTAPADEGFTPMVPPALLERLATLPGVAEVRVGSFVVAGRADHLVVAQGVTGDQLSSDVVDGVADPTGLSEGQVLIGAGLSRRQGVRAGDQVELTTPGGVVQLPVMGVWENGNNAGANITMSSELLEDLFGPQPPDFVSLRPRAGVTEADLAQQVEEAGLDPEMRTRSSGEVARDIADQVDAQLASFRVMQRALLAVLFVAVLSSLLLAATQRRRELGLLGAVGADPPGLARMLLVEAGVVASISILLSAIVGPLLMWSFNRALPFVIGFKNPLTFAWPSLLTASIAAMLVVVLGALAPARRAARVEVLDALRYE